MQSLHYPKLRDEKRPPLLKEKHRLLIVEDDKNFLETLRLEFEDRGYEVLVAHSLSDLNRLKEANFKFAILDLRVGPDNGLQILGRVKELSPDCRTVLLTGYGSIATAVQAMKLGACNYLTKPVSIEILEKALWMDLSEDSPPEDSDSRTSLARHEREYIEYVLNQCGGNITKAATWLGVHRQSLQRKLRKYPPRK